jgi:hypothetical protein
MIYNHRIEFTNKNRLNLSPGQEAFMEDKNEEKETPF